MRTQLGLADDPSVRINNFPFLTQAISGRYRSVDVTADHIAVGPLRDVQVRSQLRDVTAPLSQMLGDGPRTVTVREVEGTARIGAPDVERLIREASDVPVDKLYIDGIDADGLERAVDDGADPALLTLDPATAVRFSGTVDILGQEQQVSIISEMQLADGRAQITPRDVRLGDADADPLPVARAADAEPGLHADPRPGRAATAGHAHDAARHQRRAGDQRAHRAPRARPGRPDGLTPGPVPG